MIDLPLEVARRTQHQTFVLALWLTRTLEDQEDANRSMLSWRWRWRRRQQQQQLIIFLPFDLLRLFLLLKWWLKLLVWAHQSIGVTTSTSLILRSLCLALLKHSLHFLVSEVILLVWACFLRSRFGNHTVLCPTCSRKYREKNGDVCSLCDTTLTNPIYVPPTQIQCDMCYDDFAPGFTVRASGTESIRKTSTWVQSQSKRDQSETLVFCLSVDLGDVQCKTWQEMDRQHRKITKRVRPQTESSFDE